MNHDITPESAQALSYKPSAFYFRQDLRESPTRAVAITVAITISSEYELLRGWAIEQGVIPASNVHAAAELLRAAIEQSSSHAQVILLGLFVCHELEELKANVRECGLIPPKWIIVSSEAIDKGWELHESAVNE